MCNSGALNGHAEFELSKNRKMKESFAYVTPRNVTTIEQCFFYHAMDMPGVGEVGDQWDLRKTIDDYFGQFDFSGKRALDAGAASGFLTFEMEKRGASVVSFDIIEGEDWNIVPFADPRFDRKQLTKDLRWYLDRMKNAYWYAHRALQSKAHVYYGDIYDLPDGLGYFDVVLFGMVLPHLRDPFRALQSGAQRSKEWVIITQQGLSQAEPIMHFMPDARKREDPLTWWFMSEGCVEKMLGVLGFELQSKLRAKHYCVVRSRWEECTTFIARRRPGAGS